MDIAGHDKAVILKALFNGARTAPMARLTGQARGDLTTEEAREVISQAGHFLYFDYLFGRVLKIDLGTDFLDFRLYDRDNGQGAGERAVLEALTRP